MNLRFMQGLLAANSGVVSSLDTEILADAPFAYWRFDDLTGAGTLVGAVNARDLIPTAGPTLQQPPLVGPGFSIDFNGTTQYATTTNNQYGTAIATAFNGDTAFTLEAVIRLDTIAGGTRAIVHVGNFSLGGSQGFCIQINADGSLGVQAFIGGSFLSVTTTNSAVFTTGIYIIAATRAVGGATNLYINGVNVKIGSMAGSISAAAGAGTGGMRLTTATLFGAAGGGNPAGFLDGRIDYPCIFQTALSPARILAHAQAAGLYTASDTFFSSVTSLLHFDGTNGSTTFTDVLGNTWTPTGSAQISTTNPKFGTGCGLFASGATTMIRSATNPTLFSPGTGDWTVEKWILFTGTGGQQNFFEINNTLGTNPPGRFVVFLFSGMFSVFVAASGVIISSGFAPTAGLYYHIAISKTAGSYKFFVNGIQQGPTVANAVNIDQGTISLGSDGALNISGRIDDFRFTKGVGRYTANFIPPSVPFPDS